MSSKPIVLFQTTAVAAAETAIYTQSNGAGTLVIADKFSGINTAATSISVTVKVVQSGGTAGAGHVLVKDKSLLAGEAYGFPEIVGQKLNPGDFISVLPSAVGLNLRGSGTLVTV